MAAHAVHVDPDTGITELVGQLASDSKRLVRDEILLGKLEVKESIRTGARGVLWLSMAFGIAVIAFSAMKASVASRARWSGRCVSWRGLSSWLMIGVTSTPLATSLAWYSSNFSWGTSKATWNGFPALKSPTNVLILFSQVSAPPPKNWACRTCARGR